MLLAVTSAMTEGNALVCQIDQVLVGVRDDPSIAISSDSSFSADSVAVRCTARVDVDVADVTGLLIIGA